MEKYNKLDKIKNEDFRKEQPYIGEKSLDKCKAKFRLRTEMIKTFKDNFRCKYRLLDRGEEDRDPGLICSDCDTVKARDSQAHCVICPTWGYLRINLDMENIDNVLMYFKRVFLGGREEKEENERIRKKKEKVEFQRRRKC